MSAPRSADVFAIAAWAGAVFGIAEGGVLALTRQFPLIVAPYKTSAHILWVAPALNVVLFLFAAIGLVAVLRVRFVTRRLRSDRLAAVATFTFLGLLGVLTAPKVLHPASATLLAAGLAAFAWRSARRHEDRLRRLREFAAFVPLMIASLGAGTAGALRARELFREAKSPSDDAINVLIVVLDTVRRDHFSWAADSSFTPNIDAFAQRGVRYQNAWAVSSWSLPSQASILTGAYPHEHNADWPSLSLSRETLTMAEYFSGRGYDTGAFSSNSSWITPEYVGRGFDKFDAYTMEDHFRRTAYGRLLSQFSNLFGLHYAGRGRRASELNESLLNFLGERRSRPFFAFVCYMDANRELHHRQLNHPFWRKPAPVADQVAAYRNGLRRLDFDVGDLLASLARRGLLANTIVVITSDHGESFGSGHLADRDPSGHGTSLFPEQVRVPLFVVFPPRIPTGRTVTSTVSLRGVPASIAYLIGDSSSKFPGAPLPELGYESRAGQPERAALATLHYGDRNVVSVVQGNWQYIRERHDGIEREHLIDVQAEQRGASAQRASPPPPDSMRASLSRLLRATPQASRSEAR